MPDTGQAAKPRAERKTQTGIVLSNKMKKTITVRVGRNVRHTQYAKIIHRATTFKVHDENNTAKAGDRVLIMETRPLSKDKRWRLLEVIERASSAPVLEDVVIGQRKAKPVAKKAEEKADSS